ncbi:MAG TPA: radical SAM protein [Acetobacteraceae bacterium]|nr:radical SAM protein [Acetobacteraceae bacterium]
MIEEPATDVHYRTAEIFLFDTCTHKCAYCHFAETGKVLDASQLQPYKDLAFVDGIAGFFSRRTSVREKWLLTLTGGEPLLMPNLPYFARALAADRNKIAFYTAMLIGDNHPNMIFLLEEGASITDYLMVSFHPEAEEIEDRFFARIERLKQAGHSVIFRFVSHPARVHRLDELSQRCRDIDVAFYATPLFSPDYPAAYTERQRSAVLGHATTLSQFIMMGGGVDTRHTRCWAGSEIISVDVRTGDILPCISVPGPVLGNIYEDRLDPFTLPITCPSAGIGCLCDVHFQQNIVNGAEDGDAFKRLKTGWNEPVRWKQFADRLQASQLRTTSAKPGIGQTSTADFLALRPDQVKSAFEQNKTYLTGPHTERHHPEFRRRQNNHASEPHTS